MNFMFIKLLQIGLELLSNLYNSAKRNNDWLITPKKDI